MSTVSSTSNTASTSSTSSSSGSDGFNNLTTGAFMQMLIAELENQDPTNPMSNQDLLSQISAMAQLQSTEDLDTALTNNTNNQQLSTAASFIGANIQGTDSNNN